MKLIIGLGNPGEKYYNTRHNFGFMVVDHLLQKLMSVEKTLWSSEKKHQSDVARVSFEQKGGKEETVLLVKPQTYMNESGRAVSSLASFYQIDPIDIWVVYDELDLPLGSMKIRFGGAAAGHHGVESIMESLGTDGFWRFRMGIGVSRQHTDSDDEKQHAIGREKIRKADQFVLGSFGPSEQGKVRELIKHGSDAIEMALEKGIEASMNRYNTK